MLRSFIYFILSTFFLTSYLNANILEKFNSTLIENYDFSQYPYLESRNDIGIFFDFSFDKDNKIIEIKRDENNYPIIRFSLFEKEIKPGVVVTKINEIDLSQLSDNDINDLIKKNQTAKIDLRQGKSFDLKPSPYKYDNIKLANFFLYYVNNIDTTKGILEISFLSTLINERPDLDSYAKDILDDNLYELYEELFDLGFHVPVEQVYYYEYKVDVDIRDNYYAQVSYDYGIARTVKDDSGIGQFRQKFNFKNFPFDSQRLIIKIGGIDSNSDPETNWPKGNASVFFVTPDIGAFINLDNYKNNNLLEELGWKVTSTDIVSDLVIYKNYFDPFVNKTYDMYENTIDLVIEVKRNSAHYIFKIIIPVFLILCVAWSVLWIPTYKLDARLTTSIVALLALIAYNFVFEDDIPKLDYLTDLDKFILLSYVFCCLPTFMSIGFSRFIVKNQRMVTVINKKLRTWLGVVYLLLTIQIFSF